jgi:hypothetical protein
VRFDGVVSVSKGCELEMILEVREDDEGKGERNKRRSREPWFLP